MSRFMKTAAWVSVLSLITIAGCPLTTTPDNNDNNQTTPTTVVGTWTGVLTGTSTKTTEGVVGAALPGTKSVTIKFGSDYAPTSIPIWGFDKAFDQKTTKNQVGETETFEYGANQPPRDITLVATIREVTYEEDNVRVVIDLEYSSTEATQGLSEEGTGTMTLEAEVNGTFLSVTASATYAVESTANNVTTDTTETLSFAGTLSKQN